MGMRLRSWSEVARFISCGVRTAQRYERELGLPVHRERIGGEVWADADELLNWVRGFKAPNILGDQRGIILLRNPKDSATAAAARPPQ